MIEDDPFVDLSKWHAPAPDIKVPRVPAAIQKRREQFVQIPMWWVEKLLEEPYAAGSTFYLAIHLWHLDWKHWGKPFKLPNMALAYDGIHPKTKWRALRELERRGLIRVECRNRKSPIIHLIRQPATMLIG
jgi:hypothetical protein